MASLHNGKVHVCSQFDLHPYECGWESEGCIHCLKKQEPDVFHGFHDPENCWLCDPEGMELKVAKQIHSKMK